MEQSVRGALALPFLALQHCIEYSEGTLHYVMGRGIFICCCNLRLRCTAVPSMCHKALVGRVILLSHSSLARNLKLNCC